eukprot:scaffold81060_cov18-Prasinocladus_malaysianus.AAC.1
MNSLNVREFVLSKMKQQSRKPIDRTYLGSTCFVTSSPANVPVRVWSWGSNSIVMERPWL